MEEFLKNRSEILGTSMLRNRARWLHSSIHSSPRCRIHQARFTREHAECRSIGGRRIPPRSCSETTQAGVAGETLLGTCPGGRRERDCVACSCLQYVRALFLAVFGAITMTAVDGYEDSLAALVDETTKNIHTYIKDEAAHHIAAIAQRVNISLKLALTIA